MKKRLMVVLAMTLSASMLFTACSSGSSSTSSSSKEKASIKISTWAGADESKEFQKIIDKLNEKSTEYKIVQDSNPADYDTRLTTQLSGKGGPDIFWVSAQRASQLAAKGAMLDITDKLSSSKKDAAKTSDYFEESLAPFKNNGKIYGLPWIMQPVVMYYNKDLFDKAGVSYPDGTWNWDKFTDAAKKLTADSNGKHPGDKGFDKSNVKQWGTTLNGWPPVQICIWQNGGDVISEDLTNSPIDTKEAKGGFKFYADLINSDMVPTQQIIKDRGFDTMFKNQQVAMFMGGAADSLETQVKFKCAVAEVPAGPTGIKATFGDILGMGINVNTKNANAAFDALIDLTQAINEWKVMPPRKSLATEEKMKELHPERADAMKSIVNSMSYAKPYRYYENYPDWDNIFQTQLMDPVINRHGNLEKLIPTVKPQLDAKLKK